MARRARKLQAVEPGDFRVAASALADRLMLAKMMGMTHEGKRDVYGVLGYDEVITAKQYRERYARGGIAARVVDALATYTWTGEGGVYEDEDPEKVTPFEQEWDALNDELDVWSTLRRTHIMASMTSFSGLLLGAEGELNTPLPKGSPKNLLKPGGLLYLTPYGGGVIDVTTQRGKAKGVDADLTISTWDEDSASPRFGLPLTYQLKRTNVSTPGQERPVHWSRIVHAPAVGFLEDSVFGPPALEDVWNYFIDLDKVVGGGSEAFWLRANAGQHWNIDKKTTFDKATREAELAHMAQQAEAYAHQQARIVRTRGVDITQLGSDVADFRNPMDAIVTLIAGTKGIPKRILMGTERGQLASGQDEDNWADQVSDCRTGYAYPVILRPFVKRLIEYGYLSTPKQWFPLWPEKDAMNEAEKIAAAESLTKLNDHGTIVVTSAEVREFLGYDPLDDKQMADELKVREAIAQADAPAADPNANLNPNPDDPLAETNPEAQQIDKLAAALRKGGTVNITVKG